MNKTKLVEILGTHFGDDPVAQETVHKAIQKQYRKDLQAEVNSMRSDIEVSLTAQQEKKLEAMHGRFEDRLRSVVKDLTKAFQKELADANQRAETAAKDRHARTGGALEKRITSLEQNMETRHDGLKKTIERHGRTLDTQSRSIERFSKFAVGAPNRSLYFSGQLASPYYSDVNFVPGAGVSFVTSSDETTQQAVVEIIASGGTPLNPQIPTGTVNSVNVTFIATGKISVAFEDGTVDPSAILSYDSGANHTTITYSVPPQNNVFAL